MAEDDIEIGEDLQIDVVVDANDVKIGEVLQIDVVVAQDSGGSIVDETIDVLDKDGNLIFEEENISVYDDEGNLVAQDEIVIRPLD